MLSAFTNEHGRMKIKQWNLWVFLHWLMAILVVILFFIGQFRLNNLIPSSEKAGPLTLHVFLGNTLLLVVVLRLFLRTRVTTKPIFQKVPKDQAKNTLDTINSYTQPLLYLFTLLMCLAGIGISLPADLFHILILRTGASLPIDFNIFPARQYHVFISILLSVFVIIHVLVFVQHQFLNKENYLKKMWFIDRREK